MLDPTQLLWTQIAAAAFVLLFVGMLLGLLRLRRRAKAGRDWVTADGEILVSEVKLPQTHTSDDQIDARVAIRYRYGVGAKTYESDRIQLGGATPVIRAHADALVARFPVGAHVDIYYDPQNPEDAALEPHEQSGVVAQLALTVAFGVIAAVLAMHAIAGKVLYSDKGVPLFAFALPALAFICAIVGVVSFVTGRRQALERARWPTAPGIVTTSAVIEERIESRGSEDKDVLRITQRYRVDLRYAYRVGQRDYVGTNQLWAWTAIYGLRKQAEAVTNAYPRGKSVTVYYDPAHPGIAVLEPSNRQGSLAPLIFAGVSAAAGALLLLFFITVGFAN